jgi:hypothetical protein
VIAVELEDRVGQVRIDAQAGYVLVEWDGETYALSPERVYTIAMALMKVRAAVKKSRTSPSPTS